MNETAVIITFILTALVAGALGGLAMEGAMWAIGKGGWAKADMIVALGSLLTKSRENARRVGLTIHAMSSVGFAVVYTTLMLVLGMTGMPVAMMLGLGVGFGHGLVVSLMLVWVIAGQHPLEEFKEADLAIGLSHLAGHVAFGGVVGLVVGVSPL
jgi:hypothetical protein